MSDDEREHSDEGGRGMPPPEDTGPSEAELAMQRRRQAQAESSADLDDAQELLEANRKEREILAQEIDELRQRSEERKKERMEEEKRMAEKRAEEEAQRKAVEEERKRKKEEEEQKRKAAREQKMAEFRKFENTGKPNFVITKRSDGTFETESTDEAGGERKSREQLEQEKRAILSQRIPKLDTSGFDSGKFTEKAKELHKEIYRLESEKYDLEKRFKQQQYDMMELAERARQMNKVGKGGLKRVQLQEDERDKFQEQFAGAPAKIEMYSTYERQKDKRSYSDRRTIFKGPVYGFPADRIPPTRKLVWSEGGLPEYIEIEGGEAPPAEEVAAEEEE